MGTVGSDRSPKRSLGEEEHPVETFGFYGKQESLGVGVQIGTPRRLANYVRSEAHKTHLLTRVISLVVTVSLLGNRQNVESRR